MMRSHSHQNSREFTVGGTEWKSGPNENFDRAYDSNDLYGHSVWTRSVIPSIVAAISISPASNPALCPYRRL